VEQSVKLVTLSFITCLLLVASVLPTSNVTEVRATGEHDVGISNVAIEYTFTWEGLPTEINVTLVNYGSYNEVSNLTVYANSTVHNPPFPDTPVIGIVNNITLVAGNSTTVTILWDGYALAPPHNYYVPYGLYIIIAYLAPVVNETNVTNNIFVGGTIRVTMPGDANGDGWVDVLDLITIARELGKAAIRLPWPILYRADLNNDGQVDVLDLIIVAKNLFIHL
jgi:hypothetical protein